MGTTDFKPITHHSDWHSWAEWNGEKLEDGTVMIIRWNDGSETKEKIIVEESSYEASDMGTPYTCTDHKAYAEAMYRGMKIKIGIRGLMAKLVSKPKKKK